MTTGARTLTEEQLASYRELGYLDTLPVLSKDEVRQYRAAIDRTCEALGGHVTRLDGTHRFFGWAWELTTHPQLLEHLQRLLGPNIVLKSTRVFYKHGNSEAFVDWHQDGITEGITDARSPAVWIGLTDATIENGCLRVVPRSQHVGLIPHETHPEPEAAIPGSARGHALEDELSGVFTSIPSGLDSPWDIEMRAGEMSVHHPCVFHGSNPNRSDRPRIGLSASYAASDILDKRYPVSVMCGSPPRGIRLIGEPPAASFEDQVAAYRASDHQIHFDKVG
jgi:ectoine hydroxylase-related dioxygenase (phytanoyl-CoA dioxygenase family)